MCHHDLSRIFRPHQFAPGETHIDLYHVYDNLSQTPYEPGIGIGCGDRDVYVMNAWQVITPPAMTRHLDWTNREPTQFISFYSDLEAARAEAARRRVTLTPPRDPNSVRIAHVRLGPDDAVYFFSRQEMLRMMETFGVGTQREMALSSANSEWFVWGDVEETFVLCSNVV